MKKGWLKTAIFLILVSAILIGTRIFYSYAADSYSATVENISGDKYFPAVKEALSKAEKSIYMAMYFVGFDPKSRKSPVTELV